MAETRGNDGLKYIGQASIPGIPARDLTAEEVAQHGRAMLLASGLYEEYQVKKAFTPKPTKAAWKGAENTDKKE